jgi:hypothetical protein
MSLLDDLEEYLPDRVINDVVGISESDPLLAAEIFMAEAATQVRWYGGGDRVSGGVCVCMLHAA